jgi:hypothetical protein
VPGNQSSWRAVRLRTGHPLSLVDVAPGGALVESKRQLLPGASVVLLVNCEEGTATVRAVVTRCVVHALRSDGVEYRGALQFEQELVSVHAHVVDLCA